MKYFLDNELDNTYQSAVRVIISAPVIVRPGEDFSIRISLLKANGYPDFNYEGELLVFDGDGIEGLPEKINFERNMEANQQLNNLQIKKEGFYRFRIKKNNENYFPSGNSNTIWCTADFPYKVYYGDMHVHSEVGKCGTPFMPKSPDFGYWYAKYIAGHDFCSITDHAHACDEDDWQIIKDAAQKWNLTGNFVSILGYEGDYDGDDGGHFNIYFDGNEGEMKNFKLNAGGSLKGIFDFAINNNAIAICHHSGRYTRGRDFSQGYFGGKKAEPCAEVISQWGSSETKNSQRPIRKFGHPDDCHYYDYAIKNGFRLGALGGSDNHATVPGGFVPMIYPQMGGKIQFEYPGAITAVFAKSLSRKDIFEAIRERRCFASANDRLFMWLKHENGVMGEEVKTETDKVNIKIISGNAQIREVHVMKNGELFQKYGSFGLDDGFDETKYIFEKTLEGGMLTSPVSYYVKVIQEDGDIAISSPIWLDPIK